jgi:hypothetical protein
LDRRFETTRLEFLDRDDIYDRVKGSVINSLDRFSERVNEKLVRLVFENLEDAESPRVLELGAGARQAFAGAPGTLPKGQSHGYRH